MAQATSGMPLPQQACSRKASPFIQAHAHRQTRKKGQGTYNKQKPVQRRNGVELPRSPTHLREEITRPSRLSRSAKHAGMLRNATSSRSQRKHQTTTRHHATYRLLLPPLTPPLAPFFTTLFPPPLLPPCHPPLPAPLPPTRNTPMLPLDHRAWAQISIRKR